MSTRARISSRAPQVTEQAPRLPGTTDLPATASPGVETKTKRSPLKRISLQSGHQMLARGAVDAGCEFFAAYPTPTTAGLCEGMTTALMRLRRAAINAPDEAAALAYAVGASARGARAMAATAGPGWSRMVDGVEYAVAAELPLVVVLVEQLGPSSGGESYSAQGDVLRAAHAVSGGFTLPLLAPSTATDCYEVARAAFYWAERLRTPVVVLCDRDVAMTVEDVADESDALTVFPPAERVRGDVTMGDPERPYACGGPGEVAPFWSLGGAWRTRTTGAAHDTYGRTSRHAAEAFALLRHVERKIAYHAEEMSLLRVDGDREAETLVVAFGITARAAIEAVRLARERGGRVAVATLLSLFPVPDAAFRAVASRARRVVVVEENLTGQYRQILEPRLAGRRVVGVTSLGRRITPPQILDAIQASD